MPRISKARIMVLADIDNDSEYLCCVILELQCVEGAAGPHIGRAWCNGAHTVNVAMDSGWTRA